MNRPSNNQFNLIDNTIGDTVSCMKWGPNSNYLAASSWDGKVRVWEIKENFGNIAGQMMTSIDMGEPVLNISWNREGTMIFAGCSDNTVKAWDLQQGRTMTIGQHTQPVAQVHWCEMLNVLYSMSWDKTIAVWDGKQPNPVANTTLERKPHYMSISYPLMAVATSNRQIAVFDLDRLRTQSVFQPIHTTESMLKYNTKSIATYQTGWVLGSIEGRCEVRTLSLANPVGTLADKSNNYTFKAHRDRDIYAVNSIAFNPPYGTFATAGGDGKLFSWDKDAKVKLKGFPEARSISTHSYPGTVTLPIVECAYNTQGTILAVAFGYDWARGVAEYEEYANEIYVHVCTKDEVEKKASSRR